MSKGPLIDDETIRAYLAAVIGPSRAPFGKRGGTGPLTIGQSKTLAQNSTKGRVLAVTVSRSDLGGAAANVIFSQSTDGGASLSDFPVTFAGITVQRFVLKQGEALSVQVLTGAPTFVVGQETY